MEYKIFRNILISIIIIFLGRNLIKMYIERDWKNAGESGAIAINAENLNYMDNAIYQKMQRNKFNIPYYYFTNIRELFKPYQSGSFASGKWGNTTGGTTTSYTTTVLTNMDNVGDGSKLVLCTPPTYINALKTENNSSLSTNDFISIFCRVPTATYSNMQTNTVFKVTINKGTNTETTNYAYFNVNKNMLENNNKWVRLDIKITDFTIVGTFDFTEINGIGISLEGQDISTGTAQFEMASIQVCRSYNDFTNPFLRRNGNEFIPDYTRYTTSYMNAIYLGYRQSETTLSFQSFPIISNKTIISGVINTQYTQVFGAFKMFTLDSDKNLKAYLKVKKIDNAFLGANLAILIDSNRYFVITYNANTSNFVTIYKDTGLSEEVTNYSIPSSLNDIFDFSLFIYPNSVDVIFTNLTTGRSISLYKEFIDFNVEKSVRVGTYEPYAGLALAEFLEIYVDSF